MTPVEEIEAAIAKLTGLRDSSLSAPWVGWRQNEPLGGERFGVESRGEYVAKTFARSETELIEVLHRTIDTQLAILRETLEYEDGFGIDEDDTTLILARAINGTAS